MAQRDGADEAAALFAGPGEMRARCRALDWADTPLGPVVGWPPALRIAAQMVVATGLPSIVLWGRELTQLYNDAYAALIRGKHPFALGRGNREVWPEVWHINGPIYERVLAGETVVLEDAHYPLERRGVADGWAREDAYLTVSFSPIRDETGTVAGVLANMLETTGDVREREVRAALAESEARHRLALDAAEMGAWTWDMATDAATFDARVRELFAFPDDDPQPRVDILAQRVHPADRDRVGAALAAAADPSGDGRYAAEYRVVRPDGSERWARAAGRMHFAGTGADRRPTWLIGTVMDVTRYVQARHELERANEQLQDQAAELEAANEELQSAGEELAERTAIAERALGQTARLQTLTAALAAATTLDEVIAVTVAEGRAATGAASGMLAVRTDGGDLTILRLAGLPADVRSHYARMPLDAPLPGATCVRTGTAIWMETREALLARFPDLQALWARLGLGALATVPLTVAGETIGAMSFTFAEERAFAPDDRDFFLALGRQCAQALERTRLLAAERAARHEADEARRAAERADRTKSEFLATMSHEIRTPINAIVGYGELLDLGIAGPVTAQQRDYLGRLRASSQHLLGLVDDVLDLAKLDAGQMSVAREDAAMSDAVTAALALVLPAAQAKGVRLVGAQPGERDGHYVGDADRVRQLLVNLLSNAVKFTASGGSVAVTCGHRDDAPPAARVAGAGPWAFVRVEDTGIGIAPEDHATVFEPFVQGEGGHTRTAGGTGLGLAISRRLARMMDGDLVLERSAPGAGSAFTLWLPAAATTRSDGAVVRESAQARGARASQEVTGYRVHGLGEVGVHLREHVEQVLDAFVARLRSDPAMPGNAQRDRAELENHTGTLLGNLAQSLVLIEREGGLESGLLKDGGEIQRMVADLHGRARRRLGWSEAAVAREYEVLAAEVVAQVRRRVPEGMGDVDVALDVVRRLLDRAAETSLRAFRHAPAPEDA